MLLEYVMYGLFGIAAAAFLLLVYFFIGFGSKLQDALARGLVQRAWLPKGRGDITWIISSGDMVPGGAPYRRGFIIAFVAFIGAFVLLIVIGSLNGRISN